jgi:hypothetical protein
MKAYQIFCNSWNVLSTPMVYKNSSQNVDLEIYIVYNQTFLGDVSHVQLLWSITKHNDG